MAVEQPERVPLTDYYERIGRGYASARRADLRVAARILDALGDARSVVNVGAGTGNYEPSDRPVVAVEPAETMLAQRQPGSAPVVRAVAQALPFPNGTFGAALAVLTVHHWVDLAGGLAELRRVADRQVIVSFDEAEVHRLWLVTDYFPDTAEVVSEAGAPTVDDLAAHLEVVSAEPLPVPADCTDGFGGAYWNRPEAMLDPSVRAGMSHFALLDDELEAVGVERLRADLESGAWDERYGWLRTLPELDVGYRLVVAGR